MTTLVLWDEALLSYNLGDHPLDPVRVELTMALARELGLFDRDGVEVRAPRPAGEAALTRVHDPEYLAAVKAAGRPGFEGSGGSGDFGGFNDFGGFSDFGDAEGAAGADRWPGGAVRGLTGYGLGTSDNPVFERMHEASALVAGATLAAAEAVWQGRFRRAVNVAGGLHHAMPRRASGFCVYNDPAVAISRLLDLGAQRIAYVDVDVHHGDGVQAIFYADPRVLTISLHETPLALFPGTGFAEETGAVGAEGTAVNVALPPGTQDAGWLRAFHAVVPAVLRAYRPQVLFTQCGADTHRLDPLAHLRLSVDGQRAGYLALRALAEELCEGRWVATGGGGYALVEAVPRAWTHLLAIATGEPIDPATATPAGWRALARQRRPDRQVPSQMTDGADPSYRPWQPTDDPDEVDRAIVATRRAVFPLHGLDPDARSAGE